MVSLASISISWLSILHIISLIDRHVNVLHCRQRPGLRLYQPNSRSWYLSHSLVPLSLLCLNTYWTDSHRSSSPQTVSASQWTSKQPAISTITSKYNALDPPPRSRGPGRSHPPVRRWRRQPTYHAPIWLLTARHRPHRPPRQPRYSPVAASPPSRWRKCL